MGCGCTDPAVVSKIRRSREFRGLIAQYQINPITDNQTQVQCQVERTKAWPTGRDVRCIKGLGRIDYRARGPAAKSNLMFEVAERMHRRRGREEMG